ncbi:hypothetical protein M2132_001538 [Dysgonomonas sp. PH5-45]|uniref:hypothetical protein n=1 Tax=unclassified Dysgonomonas TaxID=2630389 RepID=UPI002475D31E|nr:MULTISPECIES: hypothetical protein [unclassified Dysgonomonas]MDH6355201.1 hypothetical protein [Dysgonomonas sp. PH5-45]MDH6388073.1 hypothetical protein [Dysgonomonas sp. PH5-37]
MRYAAGISVFPIRNVVFRVYGDVYSETDEQHDALPEGVLGKFGNQYSLALFAGYQNKELSGGVEYNRVFNKGFVKDKDYYGYFAYVSYSFAPKWRVYARYDLMDSKTPHNFSSAWNNLGGQLMVGGIEYQPLKQVKVSPNFRNINPDRAKSEQYLFVNLDINI